MNPYELSNDDLVTAFLDQREPSDLDLQLVERFEVAVDALDCWGQELRAPRADRDGDDA